MWPGMSLQNAGTRIKRYEKGQKPRINELELLAKALEIDPAELMETELGEGWSQEIKDGGFVIQKNVLDQFPELKGYLEILNTAMDNEKPEVAEQTLKMMIMLFQGKGKTAKKAKA
jgi:hypothetical protein